MSIDARKLYELHMAVSDGRLDLQPGFQRGDVWSRRKQQRLVDSVIRGWYVPPIHVVLNPSTLTEEILDGKQRLASLEGFRQGEFPVIGSTEPIDSEVLDLDGLKYEDLSAELKRRFDDYELTTVVLSDFDAEEPGELFFRLNQPANLTPPEQRNAFYGPVRFQVRQLVKAMPSLGLDQELLGFSNDRMAYDDVIARAGFSLTVGSLREKVTANKLADLYRSKKSFSDNVERRLKDALETLGSCRTFTSGALKFNKATMYSWLCFHATINSADGEGRRDAAAAFTARFEEDRLLTSKELHGQSLLFQRSRESDSSVPRLRWRPLFAAFADRSSSRVADVTSVLVRDVVLWLAWSRWVSTGRVSEVSTGSRKLQSLEQLVGLLANRDSDDPDWVAAAIIDWTEEAEWGNLVP